MGRKLKEVGGLPRRAPPEDFAADLRPYQADGLSWLSFLREVGLGGILADDMGLGKTVQALALIAAEKSDGRLDQPALVIAPTSLMANWRLEAEKFAPESERADAARARSQGAVRRDRRQRSGADHLSPDRPRQGRAQGARAGACCSSTRRRRSRIRTRRRRA